MKHITLFQLAALVGATGLAGQAPQQESVKQMGTHEYVLKHTLPGHAGALAISPVGPQLASGSEDKAVKLWDVETGVLVRTLTGPSKGAHALSYSPDGRLLAIANGDDKVIKLWDVQTGTEIHSLTGPHQGCQFRGLQPGWASARIGHGRR